MLCLLQEGVFQQINFKVKSMTVGKFRASTQIEKYKTPTYSNFDELDRLYWKQMESLSPTYSLNAGDETNFYLNRTIRQR